MAFAKLCFNVLIIAVIREDSDGTTLARAILDRCPGGRRGRNGAPPPQIETYLLNE